MEISIPCFAERRVTLTKLPKSPFFSKSIDYGIQTSYSRLNATVSEHLPDDSDKFASTVPKGIVMSPAFRSLGIIISFESSIVFTTL